MAQISRLHRLIQGAIRGVDLASNTVVVGDVQIGGLSGTVLTKTILDRLVSLQNGTDVDATYHTHDGRYRTETELASISGTSGAELIGIKDTGAFFTGNSVEEALAENAAAIASASGDVADLVTLSGVAAGSASLGTFTGDIIADSSTVKTALQSLETAIEGLPDPLVYKGTWDASTNTPTLDNSDTDVQGFLYQVSVAGSTSFGAGSISFEVGDKVVNNGTTWDKWDMTDAVTTVNGQAGTVVLDTDDVSEGGTNKYFSISAARSAAVVNSTAGSETDQAPSVSSIKSYIATQVGGLSSETLQVLANAGESMATSGLFALRWGKPAGSETSGRLYKADNAATTADSFRVVALIKVGSALSAGDPATAVKVGKLTATSHGFTVGEPIFLGATGALTQTAPSTTNLAVVCVGIARDANTIDVQIEVAGVN